MVIQQRQSTPTRRVFQFAVWWYWFEICERCDSGPCDARPPLVFRRRPAFRTDRFAKHVHRGRQSHQLARPDPDGRRAAHDERPTDGAVSFLGVSVGRRFQCASLVVPESLTWCRQSQAVGACGELQGRDRPSSIFGGGTGSRAATEPGPSGDITRRGISANHGNGDGDGDYTRTA